MTIEAFIRKWLGNPEKPYTPENRDEMRDDLDKVIDNNRPEQKQWLYILAGAALVILLWLLDKTPTSKPPTP